MDILYGALTVIGVLFSVAVTIFMLTRYNRPRRVRPLGMMLSIVLAWVMLGVYFLIAQNGTWMCVRIPLLLLGLGLGFWQGRSYETGRMNTEMVVRMKPWGLLFWGFSIMLVQLTSFGGLFGAWFGMFGFVLSTGMRMGVDLSLLQKRIVFKTAG